MPRPKTTLIAMSLTGAALAVLAVGHTPAAAPAAAAGSVPRAIVAIEGRHETLMMSTGGRYSVTTPGGRPLLVDAPASAVRAQHPRVGRLLDSEAIADVPLD